MFETYNGMEREVKFILITMALLLILTPGFALIHEYAHVGYCNYLGHDAKMGFSVLGFSVSCNTTFDNPIWFRGVGGFTASLVAISAVWIFGRKFIPLTIVLIAIAITEYIIGLSEALANSFYMQHGIVLGFIPILIVIIILYKTKILTKEILN